MAYTVPEAHTIEHGVILLDLDASSSAMEHDLGYTVRTITGKEFVYVQVASANVVTYAGYPAYWMSGSSEYLTTSDADVAQENDGTDGPIGCTFAGVFTCAIAAVSGAGGAMCFAWIQTKGEVPDASISTGVAAQEVLLAEADTYLNTYSTASESSSYAIAYALEAGTSGFGDIMLLDR